MLWSIQQANEPLLSLGVQGQNRGGLETGVTTINKIIGIQNFGEQNKLEDARKTSIVSLNGSSIFKHLESSDKNMVNNIS